MLKLIKYEFRKALTGLLVLLSAVAACEAYFLVSLALDNMDHVAIATLLLVMGAYALMIFMFVRGLTTYSNELKNRSAYLIFMTPNSGLKIMASKYLYTFVNGLLLGAVMLLLVWLDVSLFLRHNGVVEPMFALISQTLSLYGVHLDQFGLYLLIMSLYGVLSLLSFFALAYFAITLSCTLFRDKKWRGVVSLAIFLALDFLVGKINGLFPSAAERLAPLEILSASGVVEEAIHTLPALLPLLIPSACVSLVCLTASVLACGWMLDKKVSL